MLGNSNSQVNNAVLAPFGGLGGTRSAPGSSFSFFLPASFYEAPKPIPTQRAYIPSDFGYQGFNTRNKVQGNGLLSTMLSGSGSGTLNTLRPTLLPIG